MKYNDSVETLNTSDKLKGLIGRIGITENPEKQEKNYPA